MSIYRYSYRILSSDTDANRRLRLSRLFTMLQEASIAHTTALGMGREKTLDRGLLWIVTLQQATIARLPEYDEPIRLVSWPGKMMHLLFPRYYRIEDEAGNALVEASALWALMDEKTRRVVFPEQYGVKIRGVHTGKEIPLPVAPKMPQNPERSTFAVQLCGSQRSHEQHALLRPCRGLYAAGAAHPSAHGRADGVRKGSEGKRHAPSEARGDAGRLFPLRRTGRHKAVPAVADLRTAARRQFGMK